MSNVKMKIENGVRVLSLIHRVDTSNAAEVEADINAMLSDGQALPVIVDCEQLEYISSAGLRLILRLRKAHADLKLVNASPEVYDILEMTGFTEMMTVEKAYRKVSLDGCEIIGQGANGEVYRLDEETIIKVYKNPDSLEDIKHEREVARRALILGVPTAISYDIVKVGDSYASMFEMINANSFAKILATEPERFDEIADLYVDLLKKIHETVVPKGDLPEQKSVALSWLPAIGNASALPEEAFQKLKALFEAVPDNNHMIHGDYHIKNVMLQDKEAILIDMDTLAVGDPVFEFSSIWLAYRGFSSIDHSTVKRFLGIDYEMSTKLFERTLRGYLGTDDEAVLENARNKTMLCGNTRLLSRTIRKDPGNTELIECAKDALVDLLGKVDSLAF